MPRSNHELGTEAFKAGRLDDAERLFRAALAEDRRAPNDLAAVYVLQARYDAARPLLLRALAVDPSSAKARYNLSLLLLAEQQFELGWLLHEARRLNPELGIPGPELSFPEWRGEPPNGRNIVVFGEQGFGDEIMFARYIPLLQARGADVTYVCREPLRPIMPLATASIGRSLQADYWSLICSLPLRLGPGAEPFPPPLQAPVQRGSGGGIGVVARGRPTHMNDRHRSLHGEDAQRLLSMGRDLSPQSTGAKDFLDTAKIIADLDLVIAVDTSIAHLAASMGIPTWILLPAVGVDWRWQAQAETSPWYPSVRLFRQSSPGDWSSLLAALEGEINP
ncbi:MAG: hypothetical protein JWP49_1994 [Phenylobacterium sp.]|nr:hypothetical protein [Phenylobacterium sp.]